MPHPRPRPYLFPLLPHTRPTPHPPPPKADLAVPSPFSPHKTPAAVRPSLAHKPRNKSVHRPQDVATNRRNVRNISTPSSTCSWQCPLLSSLLLKPGSPSRTWAVVTLLPLPTRKSNTGLVFLTTTCLRYLIVPNTLNVPLTFQPYTSAEVPPANIAPASRCRKNPSS